MEIKPTQAMPPAHKDKNLLCGNCRWFHVGFEGRTCVHNRGVVKTTQACVEFKVFTPNFFDTIFRDKYVRDAEKSVVAMTQAKVTQFSMEIDSYQLGNKGKAKSGSYMDYMSEEGMGNLAHTFEVVQAQLERLTEMMDESLAFQGKLDRLVKAVQAYVQANYPDTVKGLKNESERGAFYRYIVPAMFDQYEIITEMTSRIERARDNQKAAHFSLCRTQDGVMKLWENRLQSLSTDGRKRTIG